MIFQENDFLKTYNEIDKLWEAGYNNLATSLSFETVVSMAEETQAVLKNIAVDGRVRDFTFEGEYSEVYINFWLSLRELMASKNDVNGQETDEVWYERFLKFYLSYCAEKAILNYLKGYFGEQAVDFVDGKSHHFIHAGGGEDKPDIKITLPGPHEVTVECKTDAWGHARNFHGADVVIWHSPLLGSKSGEQRISLTIQLLNKDVQADLQPIIENRVQSKLGDLLVPPIANSLVALSTLLSRINTALNNLPKELNTQNNINLLDKHTKSINKTLAKHFGKRAVAPVSLPSNTADQAEDALNTAVQALVARTV
jgi:hypothetical protein